MEPQDAILTWKKLAPAYREALLVFGSLFLVVLLVFSWAYFVRKRGRRKHHHHHHRGESQREKPEQSSPRKKWRRRRREHRPRNPTLSETGGLPPVRSEEDAGI